MSIYLNVVERLNADYASMTSALARMDTRAIHLLTFELTLSAAMREPLWEQKDYAAAAAKSPVPQNPLFAMPYEEFRRWVVLYEKVMRDAGLIGTKEKPLELGGVASSYFEGGPDGL